VDIIITVLFAWMTAIKMDEGKGDFTYLIKTTDGWMDGWMDDTKQKKERKSLQSCSLYNLS
jgi:hypothetical protein